MRGNEDRRAGAPGHSERLALLRQATVRAEGNATLAATTMYEVTDWVDRTGLTGFYASERDNAAEALLIARDAARQLARDIDRALAQLRNIA